MNRKSREKTLDKLTRKKLDSAQLDSSNHGRNVQAVKIFVNSGDVNVVLVAIVEQPHAKSVLKKLMTLYELGEQLYDKQSYLQSSCLDRS